MWIGLNDVTTEGTFRWLDGSHVTYTKWASNLPDNQEEHDCVRMTVDEGTWDETSCGKKLPFVCEKDAEHAEMDAEIAPLDEMFMNLN